MLPFLMDFYFKLSKKSLAGRFSLRLWQTPALSRGKRLEISGNHGKISNLRALRLMKGQEIKKKAISFYYWKLEEMKI